MAETSKKVAEKCCQAVEGSGRKGHGLLQGRLILSPTNEKADPLSGLFVYYDR